MLRALLNAGYAFVAPALMNVLLNAVPIALLAVPSLVGESVRILDVAWALLGGAVLRLVFLLVMAHRRGFRYRPTLRRHPEVAAAFAVSGRPLVSGALIPLTRTVEQVLVSFLPAGSITLLNYGYRLIAGLGGSVFFRSVIVALLPRLTRSAQSGDTAAFRRTTGDGIVLMLAVGLPLTAFVAVLARPGAVLLFQRGGLGRDEALLLGSLLILFATTLAADGLQRALLAPFFACLQTSPPLRNTAYGAAVNLGLLVPAILLAPDAREAVLFVGAAYAVAQWAQVGHAAWVLHRVHGWPQLDRVRSFLLTLLPAVANAAAIMLALTVVLHLQDPVPGRRLLWGVVGSALAGLVTGLGVAWWLRPAELTLPGRRPRTAVVDARLATVHPGATVDSEDRP